MCESLAADSFIRSCCSELAGQSEATAAANSQEQSYN